MEPISTDWESEFVVEGDRDFNVPDSIESGCNSFLMLEEESNTYQRPEEWQSGVSEVTRSGLSSFPMLKRESNQYQYPATSMDRTKLSGSSMDTLFPPGSSPDQDYAASPLSSIGSPMPEGGFMRTGSSYIDPPQNDFLSPETAAMSRELSSGSNLFDIEKEGDPQIKWYMYYKFVVTKTTAYHQLHSGYLPTAKYPFRINSEKVTINGEKRHPCGVYTPTKCTARPFTRHYDLERHFRTMHKGGKEQGTNRLESIEVGETVQSESVLLNCDYKKCPHKESFRKDHFREHYREFHNEDLLKRGQPKATKAKNSKKKPETTEDFLASRIKNLDLRWWRCSRCVQRVYIDPNGYTCPNCNNLACEPERVRYRENRRNASKNSQATDLAFKIGTAESSYVADCDQCRGGWVPSMENDTPWAPCPRCQREARTTLSSQGCF